MVCDQCGNGQFKATLTTRTEYTYVFEHGQWIEVASEVVDGGDLGDVDTFACTDCGEDVTEEDLITQDAYDARQDDVEYERRDLDAEWNATGHGSDGEWQ